MSVLNGLSSYECKNSDVRPSEIFCEAQDKKNDDLGVLKRSVYVFDNRDHCKQK